MFLRVAALTAVFVLASVAARENREPPNRKATVAPRSAEAAIARPSSSDAEREREAPTLDVAAEQAREAARQFLDWAGASNVRQREQARRAIASAQRNHAIAAALCDEIFGSQASDHSRSLPALSVLGEMRSSAGEECLRRFLHQPFPEKGTLAHGEKDSVP
jgi:hypothetical protein